MKKNLGTTEYLCPECSSYLFSNEVYVWCSKIGGRAKNSCSYGVSAPVLLARFLEQLPGGGFKACRRCGILFKMPGALLCGNCASIAIRKRGGIHVG